MLTTASIGSAYQHGIVDTGREPHFLFFVAFLVTFGFIRTSAHMIRAQVKWWPGNVSVGGTHIHHLVWGILLLLICGYIAVAIAPDSPWREVVAVFFGIGTGLTLDEFALWLNLKDVYWESEGRKSIDAVIIAAAVSGVLLISLRSWIDVTTKVADEIQAIVGTSACSASSSPLSTPRRRSSGWPSGASSSRSSAWSEPPSCQAALGVGAALLPPWQEGEIGATLRRRTGQAVLEAGAASYSLGSGSGPAAPGGPERTSSSITTPSEAAVGIASRAPSTPASSAPTITATIATAGFTLRAPPL